MLIYDDWGDNYQIINMPGCSITPYSDWNVYSIRVLAYGEC